MDDDDIILAALLYQRDRIDEAIAEIQGPTTPRKRKQSEPPRGTKQRRALDLIRETPGIKAHRIAQAIYGNKRRLSVRGARALIRILSQRGQIRRVVTGFWVDINYREAT